ncbi:MULTISPECIES: SiaB family protein kinase [Microvirgula]|mgnify:CR=1 FL=1|nr:MULTISPECIES: SiaB family protein kinase [Microvirgula]RAS19946.1 hypothetical protein DFO50_101329 [Microvirgula sp. AG722]
MAPSPSHYGLIMLQHFARFRELAAEHQVVFFYNGTFSQPVIAAMADALRARLTVQGAAGVRQRKLFSSFIEMAQNIVHYSAACVGSPDQRDHELRDGALYVGERDGQHVIVCGNLMDALEVPRLTARLEPLRRMSSEEIRAQYRQALRAENEATSKGAGLGFLTVARDAAEPIEYRFAASPAHPGHVMFYLQAII